MHLECTANTNNNIGITKTTQYNCSKNSRPLIVKHNRVCLTYWLTECESTSNTLNKCISPKSEASEQMEFFFCYFKQKKYDTFHPLVLFPHLRWNAISEINSCMNSAIHFSHSHDASNQQIPFLLFPERIRVSSVL